MWHPVDCYSILGVCCHRRYITIGTEILLRLIMSTPTPLFKRFHKEKCLTAILSLPTSCFVLMAGSPCPKCYEGANYGKGGKKKKRDFHVGICCASFGYVPETRSTPFCNHTLHFGGLTMKNTQKNKNNREGGGKRCCGREKRRTISTNTRACGGGGQDTSIRSIISFDVLT